MNTPGLIAGILMSILAIALFLPEKTYADCTCAASCRERGYLDGICRNGHSCTCIEKYEAKHICRDWCHAQGYQNGTYIGGFQCICDKKGGKQRSRFLRIL